MTDQHKKEWNEDLVKALEARHQQAWQQQRQSQYMWRDGAKTIEAVRKSIRLTKTGKIFNLPTQDAKKFTKTVYEECVKIVKGESPIHPPGFAPLSPAEQQQMASSVSLPYIEKMERESGGYAILLAFHFSGRDSLTKDQLCSLAQPYSKTEMEGNFHTGRMYGAWKSNETLARHGLITVHKAGVSFTNRGFRSNGKNTYSISQDGKRGIEQMFQKWPDIAQRTPSLLNGGPDHGGAAHSPASSFMGSMGRRPISSGRGSKKKSPKSGDDEQELCAWIDASSVGAQKVFKVGKARRFSLHKLCDKLEQKHPGLRLEHESEPGSGSRRDMYITLRGKPTGHVQSVSSVATYSAAKKSPKRPNTAISGSGQKLGGVKPPKKPRSAKKAAANAAFARFEETKSHTTTTDSSARSSEPIVVELFRDDDEKEEDRKPAAKPNISTHMDLIGDDDDEKEEDRKPAAKPTRNVLSHVDLIGDDDDEKKDRKPAAKPTVSTHRNPYDYQPGDECIIPLSGEGPFTILRVHVDGHVTVRFPEGGEKKLSVREVRPYHASSSATAKCNTAFENDTSGTTTNRAPSAVAGPKKLKRDPVVIDLCDDAPNTATTKETPALEESKLLILIDDRERSRNHKPRELRIELSKELQSGSLKDIWPEGVPNATVEERKLEYGDFAFEATGDETGPGRLSVVVERKRVADLIQRSASGDHWKQLARMRDHCQHAIMLIENDTKFAERFDAYGSQALEPKPCHHTIENDADLFLFMMRAVLSSPKIKFVQTKDSRGTFRSIGAIGLMAQASKHVDHRAPENPPKSATEQHQLRDRLTSGGIHWKLAKEVAFQFGSVAALESAFNSCSSLVAKQALVEPILKNMGEIPDCPGKVGRWSEAIFAAFSSLAEVRTTKKRSYEDIKAMVGDNVCDPALLLCNIYKENTPDAALDAAMDCLPVPELSRHRVVRVEISNAFEGCFDKPTESSFYTIHALDDNPWSLPVCRLSTSCGNLYSDTVAVHVIEGTRVVEDVAAAIQDPKFCSFVAAAIRVASKWKNLCQVENNSNKQHRHTLLVRGLGPALEKAAKAASYRMETTMLCEMVFACLMIDHDMVVLQAVRKKREETALMLRQMALACYHYQMLYHERSHK